jgi:opacity protein-like surface antigen
MDSLKVLSLAGLVALGAIPAAHAADLLPPVPELEPYMAPVESSGWYLRGDVGVGTTMLGKVSSSFSALNTPPSTKFDQAELGDSAFVDLGFGYKFNNWLRADITGEYRMAERYSAVESYANIGPPPNPACGTRCYDTYGASVLNSAFLANGYVDIGTWANLTPYVGVGVGVANKSIMGLDDVSAQPSGGFGMAADSSKWGFAWALMAGLSYAVTPNVSLELGYRYLNTGTATSGAIFCQNSSPCPNEVQHLQIASQDIKVGMRWMFGEAEAPMPPPPPLVTKY